MNDLRWGVLGTAGIAETVVPAIERSEAGSVRAVASRSLDRARAWGERMGIPLAYGSYAELLASGEIDVVYNPLPNALHAEWTIRALEAGLPVLCEKPFALTEAEAARVAAVAARTGLPVAEAFMYRYHPMFDKARELVAEGTVGTLVSIDSCFSFLNDEPGSIVASAALGGGALMDVGCYCVNFSRLIAGAEPMAVTALMTGDTVDETLVGTMRFPGGVLARFETSIASAERHAAEVVGTTGSILLPSPWLPGTGETLLVLRRWDEPDVTIPVPGADTYRLEVEDFAHAVVTGREPRWPVADAVANMAVIERLLAAARESLDRS